MCTAADAAPQGCRRSPSADGTRRPGPCAGEPDARPLPPRSRTSRRADAARDHGRAATTWRAEAEMRACARHAAGGRRGGPDADPGVARSGRPRPSGPASTSNSDASPRGKLPGSVTFRQRIRALRSALGGHGSCYLSAATRGEGGTDTATDDDARTRFAIPKARRAGRHRAAAGGAGAGGGLRAGELLSGLRPGPHALAGLALRGAPGSGRSKDPSLRSG